jgi:hypothetical protein
MDVTLVLPFFTPNWSFLAKLDGEFASGTEAYAGTGRCATRGEYKLLRVGGCLLIAPRCRIECLLQRQLSGDKRTSTRRRESGGFDPTNIAVSFADPIAKPAHLNGVTQVAARVVKIDCGIDLAEGMAAQYLGTCATASDAMEK